MNPYAPPSNSTAEVMAIKASRRPASVWLLVLAISAITILFMVSLVRYLWVFVFQFAQIQNHLMASVGLVWRAMLVSAFLATTLGIFYRRNWGRWIGVLVIVAFIAFSFFGPDTTVYKNDAERAGGHLGRIIIFPALLAWWAYALAFSQKSKAYFSN